MPDLITNQARLSEIPPAPAQRFVTDIIPGHLHLRLSNGTANIGKGEMRVREGASSGRMQMVDQVIRRSDGTFFTREAGQFVFHPTHNHFHVDDWAEYRIREVLPGDGVGKILYGGRKTSFCLVDMTAYTGPEPLQSVNQLPQSRTFVLCTATEQGISVGWEDVYFWDLPDQWIDVTGITPGEYWLESEVDPDNHILETDEGNNASRIKLTINPGDLPTPDEIPLSKHLPFVMSIMVLLMGTALLFRRSEKAGGN